LSAGFKRRLRRRSPSRIGDEAGKIPLSGFTVNESGFGEHGGGRALFCLLALALFMIQTAGVAEMASTTTTTTHTRVRVTTTLTETTTQTADALGSRPFVVLIVLVAVAASVAVLGGYVWGRKRTRKDLLGASN